MEAFNEELRQRLDLLREKGLYRQLRRVDSPQSPRIEIHGRAYLNFSSNDYLGLANDSRLKEAAVQAIAKFGVGAGASRLICGSVAPHHELESALAEFKGSEAALTFSSGYATALGTICALLEKDDVIAIDKRVHACIVDAAKLSGAKLRVYAHNDLDDLENILKWADRRSAHTPGGRRPRTLIATESIFSMDGDHAPLDQIVELKEKYGAWLMVDEAHATGLYGPALRGLAEKFGVNDRIEIQMGTLGKALGAAGGYVCGSRVLIDYLVNRARNFIFSTAPPPAMAAAATAALHVVQSSDGGARCQQLWQRAAEIGAAGKRPTRQASAIIPILIGDESKAVETASTLEKLGIYIPAIRYPTVPRGQARLRLTVSASHTSEDVAQLLAAFSNLKFQI